MVHPFPRYPIQLEDLHKAWEIDIRDEFVLSLPLNHIHGLVTGMLNGLMAGHP